jgi:CubicO group peptidase (beta-lactamase class C family)
MKKILSALFISALISRVAYADSAVGVGNPQDFYRPFNVADIPVDKMQQWPYYKYVSANWDQFVLTSTAKVGAAAKPVRLTTGREINLNSEFKDGQSYIENLLQTQTKGFVVLKDNQVLAEFYDNGYNLGNSNLLQSASKTYAGVIIHKLVDAGKVKLDAKVETILPDFKGTTIGAATVGQLLDMTSGADSLSDYHTPGTPGQLWEIEIGLQPGNANGHVNAIKAAVKTAVPGEKWQYTDHNTDTLALIAEKVTGKKYAELLAELANEIGAQDVSSIVTTRDGTASPSYGISVSARDYALFHQWIAQGKAPKSFYASAMDTSKSLIQQAGLGELFSSFGHGVTYGSQTYYIPEHNVLFSFGSFGQLGFSDMESGIAVINQQDWVTNGEVDKLEDTINRSVSIINALRDTDRLDRL